MKKVLEVKNLKRTFKKASGEEFIAVNGISFDLYEGEIFSFLGPNGAGKSTSINMMTTQLLPTAGTIKIGGVDIVADPIHARTKIGVVAQHNNLDRGLTAKENLIYHGRYHGMSQAESLARATQLLKDFGLANWQNDYVKSFSGGMAQRLKIARAIMHEPEILFLDEPTTGLDPAYREILWEHVLRLKNEHQTTVFLTTHYMEEPERFSDRVAIYDHGKIMALGTIDELREQVPSDNIIYLQLETIPAAFVQRLNEQANISKVIQSKEKVLTIYPNDGHQVLMELLALIEKNKLVLENIKMTTTTLDDVFVHFTNELKEAK